MNLIGKLATILFLLTSSQFINAGEIAVDGYCLVCYQTAGKAVKGSKDFSTEHQGKTYYFTSGETLQAFKKSPDKYLPAYDGWCAYGMSFGKKIPVDPNVFSVVSGRLYLNKDAKVGKTFEKDKANYIQKADAQWQKLSK